MVRVEDEPRPSHLGPLAGSLAFAPHAGLRRPACSRTRQTPWSVLGRAARGRRAGVPDDARVEGRPRRPQANERRVPGPRPPRSRRGSLPLPAKARVFLLPRPRGRRPARRPAAGGLPLSPGPSPPPCRPPGRRWPSHRDGRGDGGPARTAEPEALARSPARPPHVPPNARRGLPPATHPLRRRTSRRARSRRAPSASLPAISSAFDSLLRVLFIFPSRYVFAIGLSPVFSLGWGLPPSWGCIPEQPDSGGRRRPIPVKGPPGPPATSRTGLSPSAAPRPRGFREAVGGDPHDDDLRGYNSGRLPAPGFGAWAPPASLAATEGIVVTFCSCGY